MAIDKSIDVYVTSMLARENNLCWWLQLAESQIQDSWDLEELTHSPVTSYRLHNLVLQQVEDAPLEAITLHRFMFGHTKANGTGKKTIAFKGFVSSECGVTDRFKWPDDRGFFDTSSSHQRKLLSKETNDCHVNILKWKNKIIGVPNEQTIWSTIWKKYREEKINLFCGNWSTE